MGELGEQIGTEWNMVLLFCFLVYNALFYIIFLHERIFNCAD